MQGIPLNNGLNISAPRPGILKNYVGTGMKFATKEDILEGQRYHGMIVLDINSSKEYIYNANSNSWALWNLSLHVTAIDVETDLRLNSQEENVSVQLNQTVDFDALIHGNVKKVEWVVQTSISTIKNYCAQTVENISWTDPGDYTIICAITDVYNNVLTKQITVSVVGATELMLSNLQVTPEICFSDEGAKQYNLSVNLGESLALNDLTLLEMEVMGTTYDLNSGNSVKTINGTILTITNHEDLVLALPENVSTLFRLYVETATKSGDITDTCYTIIPLRIQTAEVTEEVEYNITKTYSFVFGLNRPVNSLSLSSFIMHRENGDTVDLTTAFSANLTITTITIPLALNVTDAETIEFVVTEELNGVTRTSTGSVLMEEDAPDTFTVTIKIVDSYSRSLVGVDVWLLDITPFPTQTTDINGEVEFSGLHNGVYNFSFAKDYFKFGTDSFTISDASTSKITTMEVMGQVRPLTGPVLYNVLPTEIMTIMYNFVPESSSPFDYEGATEIEILLDGMSLATLVRGTDFTGDTATYLVPDSTGELLVKVYGKNHLGELTNTIQTSVDLGKDKIYWGILGSITGFTWDTITYSNVRTLITDAVIFDNANIVEEAELLGGGMYTMNEPKIPFQTGDVVNESGFKGGLPWIAVPQTEGYPIYSETSGVMTISWQPMDAAVSRNNPFWVDDTLEHNTIAYTLYIGRRVFAGTEENPEVGISDAWQIINADLFFKP